MDVFQLKFKIYLTENILMPELQGQITDLIDSTLSKDEEMSKFHKENKYKMYSYDRLYPLEQDKLYKKGNMYTLTLRTISLKVANFFQENLVYSEISSMKCFHVDVEIIPKRYIDTIYSITPTILKTDEGYWRTVISIQEFEKRLKVNLIKKYNMFFNQKLDEDFELYSRLEFLNTKPIPMKYKDIVFLGDKVKLYITENETAQNLAHMSIGVGLLENNARGAGFVNYQWIK